MKVEFIDVMLDCRQVTTKLVLTEGAVHILRQQKISQIVLCKNVCNLKTFYANTSTCEWFPSNTDTPTSTFSKLFQTPGILLDPKNEQFTQHTSHKVRVILISPVLISTFLILNANSSNRFLKTFFCGFRISMYT